MEAKAPARVYLGSKPNKGSQPQVFLFFTPFSFLLFFNFRMGKGQPLPSRYLSTTCLLGSLHSFVGSDVTGSAGSPYTSTGTVSGLCCLAE